MVNKKNYPVAVGAAQRGKEITHDNYSISTCADTITIPLKHYLELVAMHQPEKYQRDAEKVAIIRRIVKEELKRDTSAPYVSAETLMAVLGDEND